MIENRPGDPGRRPAQPAQPVFYDADYAPPGATNVLDHGWDVYDDRGKHIGSVDQVYDNYFSIAEGYIIHQLVYAPFTAIDHVDLNDHQVYLNVSQQQIETL